MTVEPTREPDDRMSSTLNVGLLRRTAEDLIRIDVASREVALAACAPVVARFGIGLSGRRKDRISAWTSLDASIRGRMSTGVSKAVTLALIGRALRLIRAEGRFEDGERNGFAAERLDR